MHRVKGKGHTIDERVPSISVFRRKPGVGKKVFLPQTIKYTPHPKRAEKNKRHAVKVGDSTVNLGGTHLLRSTL